MAPYHRVTVTIATSYCLSLLTGSPWWHDKYPVGDDTWIKFQLKSPTLLCGRIYTVWPWHCLWPRGRKVTASDKFLLQIHLECRQIKGNLPGGHAYLQKYFKENGSCSLIQRYSKVFMKKFTKSYEGHATINCSWDSNVIGRSSRSRSHSPHWQG